MFKNYSETYAAAITTFAPMIALLLGRFGVEVLTSDIVLILSLLISGFGFIWQLVNRHRVGDINAAGVKI